MKLQVKPSIILWLSLFFYLRPKETFCFVGAVFIHELGHFASLYLLGIQPKCLTISALGCTLNIGTISYTQEINSASGGPILSLLSGFLFRSIPYFSQISFLLGGFNLLPIGGLDGGRMISALLHLRFERASQICTRISLITTGMVFGAMIWMAFQVSTPVLPLATAGIFLLKAWTLNAETNNHTTSYRHYSKKRPHS